MTSSKFLLKSIFGINVFVHLFLQLCHILKIHSGSFLQVNPSPACVILSPVHIFFIWPHSICSPLHD